ncbi:MAG: AAA family ATPase, partial [Candidatus Jordarchaeaceae archaeon]
MSHGIVLSVSGKGGVGKTTFTALLLRELIGLGEYEVLAIDADPSMNLSTVLGCGVGETVGDLIDRLSRETDSEEIDVTLEQMIWEIVTENRAFDLLSMG